MTAGEASQASAEGFADDSGVLYRNSHARGPLVVVSVKFCALRLPSWRHASAESRLVGYT